VTIEAGGNYVITFALALIALVISVMHGMGRGSQAPLWLAVALLAIGMMIPWLITMSLR
jgi:hypothetical protein